MSYVIAEPCIGQRTTRASRCVPSTASTRRPTSRITTGRELYIDPDECIDCDACVEACPVDACFAEDQLPAEWAKYTEINANYFKSKAA